MDIFENKCVIVCFQPYQPVKATTLDKWLVDALGLTAIGTSVYLAYSTGAAASSNMMAKGFGLSQILGRAVWSRAQTFRSFYSKPCED